MLRIGDRWRALVNIVMNLRVRKFLSSCATGGVSRRTPLHGVSCGLKEKKLELRAIPKNLYATSVFPQVLTTTAQTSVYI
jgi:hypothetical protein